MTTTATTRKKGWWKAWLIIIVIIVVIAIVAVLSMLGVLDMTPLVDAYLGVFMFGSTSILNGILVSAVHVVVGLGLAYLFYNYLRGQQVKVAQTAYNPIGQTIGGSGTQSDSETVIS